MQLFFLIPLMTCLASGYIFKSCADEMAYLTGVITVVSLVLSLILAPWQLQLVILMFVMVGTKRLLRQNEYRIQLGQKTRDE